MAGKYFIISFLLIQFFSPGLSAQSGAKPNIIFIIFDDMNDYTTTLGGHPQVETPGISRIESAGTTFLNAFATSPKCAPSRTSFVTGKDLDYTQVYQNPNCKPFRDYFKPSLDNEEVFTLPEYMKDSGGYFTYGINKIYHCFDSDYDYDSITADPCSKTLSWSKYSLFIDGDDEVVRDTGNDDDDGVKGVAWAKIPNDLEPLMYDYRAIDSASLFMNKVESGEINTCDKPFFIMIGLRKPHLAWFIPEKYFMPDYVDDYYKEPFNIPYNNPVNSFPANGVVMAPQPATPYDDYNNLSALGKYFATYDSTEDEISQEIFSIDPLPEINPLLKDEDRKLILEQTIRANATMAYMAAIKFMDAQVARLMDSLEAHPDVYNNTIIVCASDHGYSLGEKKHWKKGTMWETDLRVPLVIADLRNPKKQVVNSSVSLLDIFPTLCDMMELNYPLFSDSSKYLDGISMLPLIENPELLIEHPVLSAYEEHEDNQCSCFPQFSVRNNRFHLIQYTSNGGPGEIICNKPQRYYERELYEIGNGRETDPNEWNNLIQNDDYKPVINYLLQWLPDSALYLQSTFRANIQSNILNCFAAYDDTLRLSFELFDSKGDLIEAPEGYTLLWTNNLTADSIYGNDISFPLNKIEINNFLSSDKLMFYFQMINDSTHAIEALDLKYIYLNPENTPSATFELTNCGDLTVCINDYTVNGSFVSAWWDFGDGHISNDAVPGPYTYAAAGNYNITQYITYGNDACEISFSKNIFISDPDAQDKPQLVYYPNPASTLVNVFLPLQFDFASISIYDLLGRELKTIRYIGGDYYFTSTVDVSGFRPGAYMLVVGDDKENYAAPLIIVK